MNDVTVGRIVRSIWFWLAAVTLLILWLPVLAVVRLFDRDPAHRASGRSLRTVGRLTTRLYPGRIFTEGLDRFDAARAYLLMANHQSLADAPVTCHIPLNMKAVFRKDFERVPIVGWLLQMSGEIGIDRSDARKAARALLECGRLLRAGCSVLIFPEGTRSKDGSLLPFNETPFRLAIRERIPVLPVVLDGTSTALPKKASFCNREGTSTCTCWSQLRGTNTQRGRAVNYATRCGV